MRRLETQPELRPGLRLTPVVGDGVVVYPNSVLVGPITVGDGAVIGAGVYVDTDVSQGAVIRPAGRLAQRSSTANRGGD
ncbi:MAG: hypothetical protein H0U92_07865 [Actinobacteria bacterium]|nr:hypothetical protein [Actinomycetota bacterium]